MADTTTVDACGLSCPQPVMLTRQALEGADVGEVVILVDSMAQVHNCSRAAKSLGWEAAYDDKGDGTFALTLKK